MNSTNKTPSSSQKIKLVYELSFPLLSISSFATSVVFTVLFGDSVASTVRCKIEKNITESADKEYFV